ncbi:Na(+)/H(+) antiporter subunit A [Nonomuraea coxensis DSM 45129]|uniref:Na(+)/H(+) antiporter subunit A n=1 Tax=Nonomuraea coxensis DSM 45129 TaxID=1122611 RepID=A0ABX8U357_9ACTN|nr:Na+/H+ antiporter subunit A [Nonomuraea coxensis]QYC41574.1 Na(+)/H(+) antiporter subunit A [Nonomuraea coxensis DSM 45129]
MSAPHLLLGAPGALLLVAAHALAAVAAPLAVRLLGRRALFLLAAAPAAALAWALAGTGPILAGRAVAGSYPWVPGLGLELAVHVGALGWLMIVLVGGVGALVLAYSARYFDAGDDRLGRFAGLFVAFAGAMLGLVVSDNLLVLYVFWELTTVLSYLLIGHDAARRASRAAATQALLVTTLGGLAMLAGFVMLGQHAGTYRWSQLAGALPDGAYLTVALLLVLLGALSKSAVFPFSFWLPAAMAAPTPVSAYLHAAAMVKAGVFLTALMTPALGEATAWRAVLLVAGTLTMLLGGWSALRRHDAKLLLAHGTVSQLGLLMAVFGAGSRDAVLAGTAMLLAHALFKAALFLVVGVIDRSTGTRDLRELSGLGRRAPLTAAVAVLAGASMAGLPPTAGFVAKEAVFEALLHGSGAERVVLGGLVLGSALTVAYTLRLLWGAFATKPAVRPARPGRIGWAFAGPAAVLAVAGLAVGAFAPAVDRMLSVYADTVNAGTVHAGTVHAGTVHAGTVHAGTVHAGSGAAPYRLAVWHGLTPALGLSALAVAVGAVLFLLAPRLPGAVRSTGARAYDRVLTWVGRLAVELTGATQRGSLPFSLGVILLVLVALPGGVMLAGRPWSAEGRAWDTPAQAVVAAGVIVAAVIAVRASRRLTAMILVGVTGYGTAVLFVLHGAPDLALTQFLVETVTIAMFVLVLRRLPPRFSRRPSRRGRAAIGVAVGVVAAGMAYAATSARQAEPISSGFADLAVSYGGGDNVVNVILVDIRAWDTMGEIAVLVAAATGVASLIFRGSAALRRRTGSPVPTPRAPVAGRWLAAAPAPTGGGTSIILQVVTRLLFHVIVLLSVYLLFSGHNAPGGGFAAGLVCGLALTVRYLAGGRAELNAAAPVDAGAVLGAGLFVSVGTGAAAMLLGGDVLQSATVDLTLPVLGEVHLVTSVFFDVGVYLIVVALVLDILRSLGAPIGADDISADDSSPKVTMKEEPV